MRFASLTIAGALVAFISTDAAALGFGRMVNRTHLGEPLNMAVPLRLAPSESMDDACVSADVTLGDERLPREQVRVRLTGGDEGRIVRITTSRAVDEPVITVSLTVGCTTTMSREFVVLIDPQGFGPAGLAAVDSAPSRESTPRTVADAPRTVSALRLPPAEPARTSTTNGATAPERVRPRRSATASSATPRSTRVNPQASTPRNRGVPPVATAPRLRLDVSEPAAGAATAALVAAPAAASASAAKPLPAASVPAAPMSVAALAASTAAALAAAPSADDARVRQLEDDLAKLRAEAQQQRDALAAMQSNLAQARSDAQQASWLPWLLGLLLALLAGLLYLASRVRALSRERQRVWGDRGDSAMAPAADSQVEGWSQAVMPAAEVTEHDTAEVPGVPPGPAVMPDTMPLDDGHAVPVDLHRPGAMEEQIDIEQQADFFTAIGQHDAAIDLLVTNLRGTGGTNPLPYLKLMEIYREQGDPAAYERTRERFNLRFNAVAPAWDADAATDGLTLEGYPQVLQRLQDAWWSPLDAMAELEQLLFQRGDEAERFDMAAYEEVVMLYRLARELRVEEDRGAESRVDVLLPLEDRRPRPDLAVRHVDLGAPSTWAPTSTISPGSSIDIELPGAFELDLPPETGTAPRRG